MLKRRFLSVVLMLSTLLMTSLPGIAMPADMDATQEPERATGKKPGDADGLWADSPFIVYDVPALSPIRRDPSAIPEDGTISDRLSIIAAKGEFEAASFVLYPKADVNSVTFEVYDLVGDGGTIPAGSVDLRVVKNWYQGGTGWYSYFADPFKKVLVPELLLHDENLIKVDPVTKTNSLRIDYPSGSRYVDISGTPAAVFDHFAEPVEDSDTLLPVSLRLGESKQLWLTLKVPSDAPAGTYAGMIDIRADGAPAGQIRMNVRVLPFELPAPKTYYDLNKDFYVMLYNQSRLKESLAAAKGNVELVEKKLLNEYRNMAEHNAVNIPGPYYSTNDKATFLRQLELMQQAGLDLNPLFGVKQTFPNYSYYVQYNNYLKAKEAYEKNPTDANKQIMDTSYNAWRKGIDDYLPTLDEAYRIASGKIGHTNFYFDGWDEAGMGMLRFQQEIWRYVQNRLGAKVYATGNGTHLELETKENFLNWAGEPTREKADQWHALGPDRIITSYAYPHTGPENPDLIRQRHGMWLYKANYDATYNYIFYESPKNIWNDNVSPYYRAFNLVYPTRTDLIDTIAWEGFREGIDDIRYATKLKQAAADAIASGRRDRAAAANQALVWLEQVDERSVNQDLLRLEMIRHIMLLLELENKQ
ncbi:COG1470 family protein [Paenibacillus sp. GYB003]|uniref:COG1470 family protein n=1 Tax=Paenibacillus sp. GYB003 TaxID=2994392 RepID=UPI002F96DDC1